MVPIPCAPRSGAGSASGAVEENLIGKTMRAVLPSSSAKGGSEKRKAGRCHPAKSSQDPHSVAPFGPQPRPDSDRKTMRAVLPSSSAKGGSEKRKAGRCHPAKSSQDPHSVAPFGPQPRPD